jgi:PAS domain S-box-containing protein
MEEVPRIPRLERTPAVVIYSALAAAPADPDVVILSGSPAQLMVFREAAVRARVGGDSMVGRPTCMAIPVALSGALVASVGCMGNRVYTDLPDEDLYLAVSGKQLGAVVDQLETIVSANQILNEYHRGRRATFATGLPSTPLERTTADAAVREGDERFRDLPESAPVTLWITDAGKQCTYVNQAWVDLTGQPFESALGDGWADSIHPDDRERSWNAFAHAFDQREPFQMEYRVRRHDSVYRWVTDAGVPRFNEVGSFVGYIGSVIDVTERKLAAEALSTLNRRLMEAQEEERARLARELHDDVNQRLALLAVSLDGIANNSPVSQAHLTEQITHIRKEVVTLSSDVQAISHRLHPARLDIMGLSATAEALCREVGDHYSMEIHLQTEGVPRSLSARTALSLYRVLQEALQNAIKHSGVRRVDVSLRGAGDEIELTVRDAGRGFEVDNAAMASGLGLTSMKERAMAVEGQLFINSTPGHGTTIQARVPYGLSRSEKKSDKPFD